MFIVRCEGLSTNASCLVDRPIAKLLLFALLDIERSRSPSCRQDPVALTTSGSTSSVQKNVPSQTATFDVNKGMELNIWVQKARARGSLFENMRVRCEYLEKQVNKFKDTFSNLMKSPLEENVIGNIGPMIRQLEATRAEFANLQEFATQVGLLDNKRRKE